ncbi:CLCA4 [Cordylochernes scorpioides]|uniref:CLCA4 n=1 Tax=Cordylochernes scorpioides TaxID=51811 RepID=A0ABY6L4V8_9ARAC|nr:CLCA4 [Cordylochernes scorpioides]
MKKISQLKEDIHRSHLKISLAIVLVLKTDDVDSFCEDSEGALEHNTLAPTKQNIRCNYKSTWTIISRHQDFTKLRR